MKMPVIEIDTYVRSRKIAKYQYQVKEDNKKNPKNQYSNTLLNNDTI